MKVTNDEEELESLVSLTTSTSTSETENESGGSSETQTAQYLEYELSPGSAEYANEMKRKKMTKHKNKKSLLLSLTYSKKYPVLLAVLALLVLVIVGSCNVHMVGKEKEVNATQSDSISNTNGGYEYDSDIFTCPDPTKIQKSDNDKDEMLSEFYDEFNQHTTDEKGDDGEGKSLDEAQAQQPIDLDELKNTIFDGWGHSYNEFKDILYDWKSTYFSSLQSGDSIFESGCGSGLNLLMTVDILKESANVCDLKVYGIEYVSKSVADANRILGQVLPQTANAQLGSPICRGDATDLFYIPSDSFDLSYTGYIDPIQDPLDLHLELNREVEWSDFCREDGHLTKDGKLNQDAVEDWYAKWVTELVRITKPGKPIIIEQVSQPTCVDENDWGGVTKQWWKGAIDKYGWDIDGDSLVTENLYKRGSGKKSRRYNVFMMKNDNN